MSGVDGSVGREKDADMKLPDNGRSGAAMTACIALMNAFNPNHSTLERRASMLGALELAMEATGDSGADAIALLAQWCKELRA